NAMFRKAFNKIQESGSNKDFGTTPDAQMYLNLSSPSPSDNKFSNINIDPPSFK
ncbi:Putative manganese-containing catalase, partial [Candidatus Arthromitus sp. SFB-1]